MIAKIAAPIPLQDLYREFLDALAREGFAGEINHTHGLRSVLATDNSIYQRLPQAAVFPKHVGDVACVARLAAQERFRPIVLTPRGGGTGTNGQSLTHGIIVDISRHMNEILEINVEERWVRVQTGVVKDQLNRALKPYGLFFAPELSTSNRATLGGMINTDASGQGSCTYGKTRDHVLELDTVLLGGERLRTGVLSAEQLAERLAAPAPIGPIHQRIKAIHEQKAELIEQCFPKLNRCLTGYDLAHITEADGRYNLNNILCGSEGTLGFIVEAKLNVLPIPKHSILVNISYAGFMEALRDARALMEFKPLSIETVDSKVLGLAMKDFVWHSVESYFPSYGETPTLGINLVEFSGDDLDALKVQVDAFIEHLRQDTSVVRLGHTLAIGNAAVTQVYTMRKRAVGLLGNVQGEIRPQPFVEDTAVPPENLADYIAEFRALLDSYNLQYGMFGHVDAGVLHVRPALDMKDPAQAALIRPITDGVAALTHKYGGLLWGEHGKGLRSEYAPKFFGELYPSLQEVKQAFDPYNQLNPGKIATPSDAYTLTPVDGVTLRGDMDRQIDERVWAQYNSAVHCNGNGACYNYDVNDPMCPSWKATRDRVHSPKGRATLVREWLRLQGIAGVNVLEEAEKQRRFSLTRWIDKVRNSWNRDENDFSHEVYDAMSGCLACKSCTGQCPIKVDVPEFRSRFLELYHSRYLRPAKDWMIGSLEFTVPWMAKVPGVYNAVMGASTTKNIMKKAGMVDSPLLSRVSFAEIMQRWNVRIANPLQLEQLSEAQRARSVILVQDAFTRYFETELVADWIELLSRLGFDVYLAPFRPNGKPLQVMGMIGAFEKAAGKNALQLQRLANTGLPLVGLDPAMTLTYRQEYVKALGPNLAPNVQLPQEWLMTVLPELNIPASEGEYRLLAHCTEKTNAPASAAQWPAVFKQFGLTLTALNAGCCGMAGTYGHETRNQETSRKIYAQSWEPLVKAQTPEAPILATGYSCRSQVQRLGQTHLPHPLQALVQHLRAQSIQLG